MYSEACIVKGLDYPEYLLEAWLNFEKQNGTLPDLERAIVQIRKQKKGVENRRMRVGSICLILKCSKLIQFRSQEAIAAAEAAPPVASTSNAMEVDGFIDSATKGDSEAGKKRERSPAAQKPSKKAKVEVAPEVAKRLVSQNRTTCAVRYLTLLNFTGIERTRLCSSLLRWWPA